MFYHWDIGCKFVDRQRWQQNLNTVWQNCYSLVLCLGNLLEIIKRNTETRTTHRVPEYNQENIHAERSTILNINI